MIELEVDLHLVKIIHDSLSFRPFIVRVDNFHSIPHLVLSSVSQGSLCGAKLYNRYTNYIPHMPDLNLPLFADDTAIMFRYSQPRTVYEKL